VVILMPEAASSPRAVPKAVRPVFQRLVAEDSNARHASSFSLSQSPSAQGLLYARTGANLDRWSWALASALAWCFGLFAGFALHNDDFLYPCASRARLLPS
jgi:hypothetical protein